MGKGADWERVISRRLTLWMSGQDKDLWLWRSPGSGSVGSKSPSLSNKALSGDIIALKPGALPLIENYSLELKNGYESACPFQSITKTKGDILLDFWTQCCRDAEKAEKYPLLIFNKKGVRGNPFIGMDLGSCHTYFLKAFESLPFVRIHFSNKIEDLYLFEMNSVLDLVEYWGKNET